MRVGVEDDGEERWRCTGVFLDGAAGGVDGVHRWFIVKSVGNGFGDIDGIGRVPLSKPVAL